MSTLVAPHGGGALKPLLLPIAERADAIRHAETLTKIPLSSREVSDLFMLAMGAYTPLDGFMGEEDWRCCCTKMTTSDGMFWPIPITLSCDQDLAGSIGIGEEVALVDADTGEVRIVKIWAAHDCGFAINPLAVEGQVQGAVWMGLGQAMSEENHYDKDTGLPMGPNMLDYRVPSAIESPDIEVKIVESIDPNGPFGAKEASEGALAAVIPALANAIHDAMGLRLHETPMTPDRVFDAMLRKERDEKRAKKGAV